MGKLTYFQIEYDQECVFYAGQNMSGRVTVALNDGMKMRGIRLLFLGRAYTHWTEHRTHHHGTGGNRRTTHETIHYSGEEIYFNQEITLWGKQKGQSGDNPTLPAGNYVYPFTLQLPPHCPSSYEGGTGYIRYFCKATIDKPWKFDHTTKAPFTIVTLYDLNLDPTAGQPLQAMKEKSLGCCCCPAGTASFQLHIPKRGFVPGEMMPIRADIANESSRKMKRIEVTLTQHVQFTAQRHGHGFTSHKNRTDKIGALLDEEDIEQQSHKEWIRELRIPPVPPTLSNCRVIQIYYDLEFKLVPHGPSTGCEVRVPITIGSIPLQQVYPQFPSQPAQPTAPLLPREISEHYPDMPPPSYEDCLRGKENVRDDDDNEYTGGNLDFAPKYPYYDWSQSSFQPSAPPPQ